MSLSDKIHENPIEDGTDYSNILIGDVREAIKELKEALNNPEVTPSINDYGVAEAFLVIDEIFGEKLI